MQQHKKFTKVTLSCDCGSPECLGEQTAMMVLVFGIDCGLDERTMSKEFEVAKQIESLLAEEGIELRDVRSGVDSAKTMAESTGVLLDILDELEKRSIVSALARDPLSEHIEWPEEVA